MGARSTDLELEVAELLGARERGGGGRRGPRRPSVAAADLAARGLVDGVRGVPARRLAARGAQAGGEPRAAPRGGDAEAHAQAGLVVVLHGPRLAPRGEKREPVVAGSGRGEFRARVLSKEAPWELGSKECGEEKWGGERTMGGPVEVGPHSTDDKG